MEVGYVRAGAPLEAPWFSVRINRNIAALELLSTLFGGLREGGRGDQLGAHKRHGQQRELAFGVENAHDKIPFVCCLDGVGGLGAESLGRLRHLSQGCKIAKQMS